MGIVVYPTRRSFIEMQSRRDFKDKLVHKEPHGLHGHHVRLPAGPVRGGDDSGIVRFIAEPSGSTPEPTWRAPVRGRRNHHRRRPPLGLAADLVTDGAGETEGADTMVVRSGLIDQIRNLVGEASGD